MSKNIKSQIFYALESNFHEGMSKHSLKAQNGNRDYGSKIFSYQSLNGLKDTAKDFANFMKSKHPEIKKVVHIRQEHVKEFLDSKVATSRNLTLQTYATRLNKIGICCSETYNKRLNFKVEAPQKEGQSEKIRVGAMEKSDFNKVLETSYNCDSKKAIQLAGAFGLRVSECVHLRPCDINLNNQTIFIHQGKGGRDRTLEIRTNEQKQIITELNKIKGKENEPILKVKADSVNQYLSNNLKRLGITKYSMQKTGVHSIRKMYATERYNELRDKGLNHRKAWDVVSNELGHGKGREDLFKVYVVK